MHRGKPVIAGAAVAVLVTALNASLTRAAQLNATWIGGVGSWSTASNWSTLSVPNNDAANTYKVLIDGNDSKPSNVLIATFLPLPPTGITVDSLKIGSGDALTYYNDPVVLGFQVTVLDRLSVDGIMQSVYGIHMRLGADSTIDGTGQIVLDGGAVQQLAGSLTIGPELTIGGWVNLGLSSQPLINNGTIFSGSGGVNILASTFQNNGKIIANRAGAVIFRTDFSSIAELGTLIDNGGTFGIGGTLLNTGRTFRVDQSTGAWEVNEGTIVGGTIETADGKRLSISRNAFLDGVTINGALGLTAATLTVAGSQGLAGTGSAELDFSSIVAGGTTTLVVGKDFTVGGAGGLGTITQSLVNHGHVVADVAGGILRVNGNSITSDGSFESRTGATLAFAGNYSISDLGTLVNSGGRFRISGLLDNAGRTFQLDTGTATWELNGTIRGGAIATNGVALSIPDNGVGTLDNVVLNGTLQVGQSTSSGTTTLSIPNGQTLSGSARIVCLPRSGPNVISSNGSFAIGSGVTVQTDGGTTISAGGAFTNYGTIVNSSSNRTTTVKGSSLTNSGLIQVTNGGTIVLGAPGSLTSIVNGRTLYVGEKSRILANGPVTFLDGSTLSVTVGSDTNQGYLQINGPLDLSAVRDSLDVHLSGDWPNVQQLVVQYSGARTGEFNLVTPGVMLDYSFSGRIYVTAVPEPAVAAVAMIAAAALARQRHTRQIR